MRTEEKVLRSSINRRSSVGIGFSSRSNGMSPKVIFLAGVMVVSGVRVCVCGYIFTPPFLSI